MVLPAADTTKIRLIRVPDDFEEHEAYRYVTGLIAKAEEDAEYCWEEILDLLEERGIIGPGDGAKPRQILVSPIEDIDGYHLSEDEDEDEEYDE